MDALIAKKRLIKQGTMQQLLTGKTRLPGFSGEWEWTTFGESFKFLKTGSNSRSDLSNTYQVRYIHYGDIHQKWSQFLDCETALIPGIEHAKVKHLPLVEEGDLIMADVSEDTEGIGVCIEVQNLGDRKMVSGLHTFLLRADKEVFADGFKGYITSIRSVHVALGRVATGISVYGVSKTNLKDIELPKPPIDEQKAIAGILRDMDSEIAALEQKWDKTKLIKQGMMQELLTGKTRLI